MGGNCIIRLNFVMICISIYSIYATRMGGNNLKMVEFPFAEYFNLSQISIYTTRMGGNLYSAYYQALCIYLFQFIPPAWVATFGQKKSEEAADAVVWLQACISIYFQFTPPMRVVTLRRYAGECKPNIFSVTGQHFHKFNVFQFVFNLFHPYGWQSLKTH